MGSDAENLRRETEAFMKGLGLGSDPEAAKGPKKDRSGKAGKKKLKSAPKPKPFVVGGLTSHRSGVDLGSKTDRTEGNKEKKDKRVDPSAWEATKVSLNTTTIQPQFDANISNDVHQEFMKKWWMTCATPKELLLGMHVDTTWYSLTSTEVKEEGKKINQGAFNSLSVRIADIFQAQADRFRSIRNAPKNMTSDQKMMQEMIQSGTLSDKIASMALLVQEAPIYQLAVLDVLINYSLKKEQRTASMALDAVKDLFIHNLLPDRHLISFQERDLTHLKGADDLDKALLFWFEDQLKKRFSQVIGALEMGMKTNVEHFKKSCMQVAADLLASKPEQEARLLVLLINKFGDPSTSVCMKAIELLKRLVSKHPVMKAVVIKEVEQLLFRPGTTSRTVYNCAVFLGQLPLTKDDHQTAAQLLNTYLTLFATQAKKKDEIKSRLMAAVLSGINKAFPYLRDTKSIEMHKKDLFNIVHGSSFNSATQALSLLAHLVLPTSEKFGKEKKKSKHEEENSDDEGVKSDQKQEDTDLVNRYYRSLYAKLMSEQVATRTRNTQFLNLLYRSIKRDRSDMRTAAFVKRIAIIATHSSAPIASGLMMLISEVCGAKPALMAMLTQIEGSTKGNDGGDNHDDDSDCNKGNNIFGCFDGSKREPLYACTSGSPSIWEITLLRKHFHPSVQKFADSLLSSPHKIDFKGDPTIDFSLNAFLNRFAFKNPKTNTRSKIRRALPSSEEPLNTNEFINTGADEIDADKRFFHKFFGVREKLREEGRARDRSRKASTPRENVEANVGSDAEADSDVDEKQLDAFADKLAEDMMDEFEEGADIDSDFSDSDLAGSSDEDDEGEGESVSGESDDDAGGEHKFKSGTFDGMNKDSDNDDDDDDEDFDLHEFDSDEDNDDDIDKEVVSEALDLDDFRKRFGPKAGSKEDGKRKKGRNEGEQDKPSKKKKKSNSAFAEYSEVFESKMDGILQSLKNKQGEGPSSISSKKKTKKENLIE